MSTVLHPDDSVCWLAVRVPDYTGGHRCRLRADRSWDLGVLAQMTALRRVHFRKN